MVGGGPLDPAKRRCYHRANTSNSDSMVSLSLTLLGGFHVRLGSGPPLVLPAKTQALLAYLAMPPGQPHPREKLATLLWGDTGEEQARQSLRQALSGLRKALGESAVSSLFLEGKTLALNPSGVDVDVMALKRLVAEGAPAALEEAAALYRGDLLEGLDVSEPSFEEWLVSERERLRELGLEALAKLLAYQTKAGVPERAIQTAVRLMALDPLQEAVHRTLMRLYAQQGRRGAALRQYQACVRVLQRELGVEPEDETKQLYQEILQRRLADIQTAEAPPRRKAPRRRPQALSSSVRPPTPETPLIGREPELVRLRQALAHARRGRGQIVAVLGEAGIGKSRLVEEIAVDGIQQGYRVLLGRCYETERILPFGPWVSAIRTGAAIKELEGLDGLPPVWQVELARLFPELGEPRLPLGYEDNLRLFEAMTRFMEHLASRQPLLVILEDIHWADEMSLRLLGFQARRLSAWSVLLVVTARDEELSSSPLLPQLLQELRRNPGPLPLTLSPLSQPETLALVRALARAGSEEAVLEHLGRQIWAVSEGNPFMVVETLRALEQGTAPRTPSESPLPERVREIIVGRLERLRERSQHLVAVASVIGREFDFVLLQRASGLREREAAEGVEELVRLHVLQEVGERFDLTHDRIRRVAYDQLLAPRRKLLHSQVAAALEDLYAESLEPHYTALARHYREGEVWDKAVTYLSQAGVQAATRSAHREAITYFEQALAALQHLPERSGRRAVELRLSLRDSLYTLGESRRTLQPLREAEALAEALGDQLLLGRISARLTTYFRVWDDLDRALEWGLRAFTLADATGDFGLQVVSNVALAQVYHARGEYPQAIEILRRNAASLKGDLARERFGQTYLPSAFSLAWLARCLGELGEFAEGMSAGEEGLRVAEDVDHPFSLVAVYFALGVLNLRKGNLNKAAEALERGLQLCQKWDFRSWFPPVASCLGSSYALSGRIHEALPLLEEAVEQAESITLMGRQSLRLAALAEAYLLTGRAEEALTVGVRAVELARRLKEKGCEAWVLRLLGEIGSHHDRPDVAQAEEYYRQALALSDELKMRPLLAHCHSGLGMLYRKIGRQEQARAELTTAINLFRSMEMTLWLRGAEVKLA